MFIDKNKVISMAVIATTAIVSTIVSMASRDREIERNVKKHFDAMDNSKEEKA